jgi:hypothetical protein
MSSNLWVPVTTLQSVIQPKEPGDRRSPVERVIRASWPVVGIAMRTIVGVSLLADPELVDQDAPQGVELVVADPL